MAVDGLATRRSAVEGGVLPDGGLPCCSLVGWGGRKGSWCMFGSGVVKPIDEERMGPIFCAFFLGRQILLIFGRWGFRGRTRFLGRGIGSLVVMACRSNFLLRQVKRNTFLDEQRCGSWPKSLHFEHLRRPVQKTFQCD